MNFKGIFKGSILSYLISAVFLFGSAAAARYNLINEGVAAIIVFVGAIISVFLGSFTAVKKAESKLLFNALSVSVFYIILIFIAAIAVNGSPTLHTRTCTLIGSILASSIIAAMFAR